MNRQDKIENRPQQGGKKDDEEEVFTWYIKSASFCVV